MSSKYCPRCEATKPASEFHKHSKTKDGLQPKCKSCALEMAREAYRRNPDAVKRAAKKWAEKNPSRRKEIAYNSKLKAKYGIEFTDYQQMFEKQGGRCAICDGEGGIGNSEVAPLFVDHCHSTGKIRGLLCMKCNSGLGHFEDQVNRMKRAINYLGGDF